MFSHVGADGCDGEHGKEERGFWSQRPAGSDGLCPNPPMGHGNDSLWLGEAVSSWVPQCCTESPRLHSPGGSPYKEVPDRQATPILGSRNRLSVPARILEAVTSWKSWKSPRFPDRASLWPGRNFKLPASQSKRQLPGLGPACRGPEGGPGLLSPQGGP